MSRIIYGFRYMLIFLGLLIAVISIREAVGV